MLRSLGGVRRLLSRRQAERAKGTPSDEMAKLRDELAKYQQENAVLIREHADLTDQVKIRDQRLARAEKTLNDALVQQASLHDTVATLKRKLSNKPEELPCI